mmetsp:Transcript_127686/g.397651  ORF Transcript_127686/g.397651 Transcript_127686/m.397651 type:complete len:420 (-) Transcript_127686:221-1480(-)
MVSRARLALAIALALCASCAEGAASQTCERGAGPTNSASLLQKQSSGSRRSSEQEPFSPGGPLPFPGMQPREDGETVHIGFLVLGKGYLGQVMKVILVIQAMTQSAVHYHLVVDAESEDEAGKQFTGFMSFLKLPFSFHKVPDSVKRSVGLHAKTLRFTARAEVFALKPFMHRILPPAVGRIILLDTDIFVLDDVRALWQLFGDFSGSTLLGLATEQQPTYWQCFRGAEVLPGDFPGARVPGGEGDFPGFNGGMQLHDLDALRGSEDYNAVLDDPAVFASLRPVMKCPSAGVMDLGDQDMFSIIASRRPQWFRVLPCSWNWQACRFWNNADGMNRDLYECPQAARIFHGNCDHDGGFLGKGQWKTWMRNLQEFVWTGNFTEVGRSLAEAKLSFVSEATWGRLSHLQAQLTANHVPDERI